jgi:two-component system, OmpR family, response regulator TctD
MRVLLVEDNRSLSKWIVKALLTSGMVVDCMHDGVQADHVLLTQIYDVVLLDLSLPRMDGITVLKNLRARQSQTPVLVLTARSSIEERVAGLDAGADDYLAKPFDLTELEARIRALVRRARGTVRNEFVLGSLHYESDSGLFRLDGDPMSLTPREHEILELLITRVNCPVSKQTLSDRIVGLDTSVSIEAIEIHVHRVRKKLEGSNVQIRTLRGLGYMLEARVA